MEELEQGSRIEDIEQLRANVEKAESRLEFRRKALARSKKLSGDVVAAQIDEEETNLREAEAFLKEVTFALQLAEKGSRPNNSPPPPASSNGPRPPGKKLNTSSIARGSWPTSTAPCCKN